MKKIKTLIIVITSLLLITGCNKNTADVQNHKNLIEDMQILDNQKTLVAYFSLYGNVPYDENTDASTSASIVTANQQKYGATQYIANMIAQQTNADQYLIEVEHQYSTKFDEVRDRNHEEQDTAIPVEIKKNQLNIEDYDVIFIGYPVWATTIPKAIETFINEYDMSDKTVIPFCTHDGYGSGNSYNDIQALSKAQVLEGLAIDSSEILSSQSTINQWLNSLPIDFKESVQNVKIQIGEHTLQGILNNTKEAQQFKNILPQTISMSRYGNREYYGAIDQKIETEGNGQLNFENGDITFCPTNNTIAIFYNQSMNPNLTMEVYVIGKVTSDLSIFNELDLNENVKFTLQ